MLVNRTDTGTYMELRACTANHRISWKIYNRDGTARLIAQAHKSGNWVTLSISEYAATSSRETIMTLDKEAGTALRDLLNEAFP